MTKTECGRLSNAAPKRSMSLFLESVNVALYGSRGFCKRGDQAKDHEMRLSRFSGVITGSL